MMPPHLLSSANHTALAGPENVIEGGSEVDHVTALAIGTGFATLVIMVVLIAIIYRWKMRRNSKTKPERVVHNPYEPMAPTVPVFVTSQSRHLCPLSRDRSSSPQSALSTPTRSISPATSVSTSDSEEQSSRESTRSPTPSHRNRGRLGRRERGHTDLRGGAMISSPSSSPRLFKSSPLVPSFHRSPYGRIKFMASYSSKDNEFQVTIISAAGLPEINTGKGCNSFVKVYLAPDEDYEQRRTHIVKHSRSPQFDATFNFKGIEMEDLIKRTLVMHVCHQEIHGITHKNSLIGVASINISTIQSEMMTREPRWIYLTNGAVNTVFQDTELEVTLSLSTEDETLTVLVNKVVNVPNKDATAVYVSYRVRCNHRPIYKARTRKYTSTHPVYHYQKNFNINSLKVEDLELHFQVKTTKVLTHGKIMGETVIGPQSPSLSGRDHWMEMLNHPKKQVSKYHKLHVHQEEVSQPLP